MKIMEEVSTILGIYVTEKTLKRELLILEKSGSLSQRKLQELIILIILKLHEMENEKSPTL